jgi:tetratricopeptide (TPR) repeat protein
MSDASEGFSYLLSVHDIDKSLLPREARSPGTDAFQQAVTKLIERDFLDFGGHASIKVTNEIIEVHYQPDPNGRDPFDVALEKLRVGAYDDAVRLLEVLLRLHPDNVDLLYNLGMALSDMGRLERAVELLARACSLASNNVNAKVALGVAYSRQQKWDDAVTTLRDALQQDDRNPWAHRNLGACLLRAGEMEEAERHLRRAVELNPEDQQNLYGLAQVLHGTRREAEADSLYVRIIQLDSHTPVADEARRQRSLLAQDSFRSAAPAGIRMDAVMYLLGAMQKFGSMSREEIQKIAFEIAILGQRGIDANDPAQKYSLRSLPGRFSGLHLLCLMDVGFKAIAPEHSIGFDLSREYEVAQSMYSSERSP